MMKRPDAIAVLLGMHQLNLRMLELAEFKKCHTVAGPYRKKAEALQTAISALEELRRNRDKARKVLTALRLYRTDPPGCSSCPYQGDSFPACTKRMSDDVEELLVAAYLEGGENDEQI